MVDDVRMVMTERKKTGENLMKRPTQRKQESQSRFVGKKNLVRNFVF